MVKQAVLGGRIRATSPKARGARWVIVRYGASPSGKERGRVRSQTHWWRQRVNTTSARPLMVATPSAKRQCQVAHGRAVLWIEASRSTGRRTGVVAAAGQRRRNAGSVVLDAVATSLGSRRLTAVRRRAEPGEAAGDGEGANVRKSARGACCSKSETAGARCRSRRNGRSDHRAGPCGRR